MKIITAMCLGRGIGFKNKLPWNIPEDLNFFKEKTLGKYVLMGNNTYQSIGRPLRNRINIVLSNKQKGFINGVNFISLNDVSKLDKEVKDKLFIIGGGEIYKLFIDSKEVDSIYVTHISKTYECDSFFPMIPVDFCISKTSNDYYTSDGVKFNFVKYTRKN
jgi:dihydrofolate reductase